MGCMDAMELQQNRWHLIRGQCPISESLTLSSWCFADKEDTVHLMGIKNDCVKKHFYAPIRDLIPNELKAKRAEKYLPLVIGYLREAENDLLDRTIVFELQC